MSPFRRRRCAKPQIPGLLPLLLLAGLLCLASDCEAQKGRHSRGALRGYTIMAGALGRSPKGPSDMWSNTEKAHLEFIQQARIHLVVIEVPYGVGKKHPRSPRIWILYPHTLAQSFDLPRQVDPSGKRVEWNCCFHRIRTQDWLVENGKRIVKAYDPDGLLLFGLFHKGSACHCASCKKSKDARSGKGMEKFFVRFAKELHGVKPKLEIGTTSFWSRPGKKTLAAVDFVSPVVGIFRPGYATGRVRKELRGLRSRYRGKQLIPYVKLFLATQTSSRTEDVLGAIDESLGYADGFLLWGYNPGHS